jgi:hypothetical protein
MTTITDKYYRKIYACHGVATKIIAEKFKYLNLLERDNFEKFLLSINERFVSLEDGLNSLGNSLTIDDSTIASANCALMARDLGHEVTIFINPDYIENSKVYHFVRLNLLLDLMPGCSFNFDGSLYHLNMYNDKLRLRKSVKDKLCRCLDEKEREELLTELFYSFNIKNLEIPDFLKPINKEHLQVLIDKGVKIENHGWSHIDSLSGNWNRIKENIIKAKSWFKSEFNIETNYFAVPFGNTLPESAPESLFKIWFLMTNVLDYGLVGKNIFNRISLKI